VGIAMVLNTEKVGDQSFMISLNWTVDMSKVKKKIC
jgi:hypothetical protein